MPAKRKYRPTAFTLPPELELAELKRKQLAEPAAKMLAESLMLLFCYSPESFPQQLKDTVTRHVKQRIPGSYEAWAKHWNGAKNA